MKTLCALLLSIVPASACDFMGQIKGECVPFAVLEKCVAQQDMRDDPVCNALGFYEQRNYEEGDMVYVAGKLIWVPKLKGVKNER